MAEPSFLRHAGWFASEDVKKPLNIIGVGATGSNVALTAARMGFQNFKIWDPDVVEAHNLPNQVYMPEHINMKKVDALESILKSFSPHIEVEKSDDYFTKEDKDELNGPLVLTVDTMKARKEIYECFAGNWQVDYVYETRLGFDFGEAYVIDNMDAMQYQKWFDSLKNDDEIEEGPCNQRICTTLVGMVSSFLVHMICSKYASERSKVKWEYDYKTAFSLSPQLLTFSAN